MSRLFFAGKRIIPAPFLTVTKEKVQSSDGRPLGYRYAITLKGTLMAERGSPDSTGAFWALGGYPPDESIGENSRLASILAKQKALRDLFSDTGVLEVQSADLSSPTKWSCRVLNISFEEGNWFEACRYTVSLEADDLTDTTHVDDASDDWVIEILDERLGTYRLTRSVSAKGRRFVDETGTLTAQSWENARTYVLNTIGLGLKAARMQAPGVLDLTTAAYNYIRSQSVNELAGTFAVTESWLCYDAQGGTPALDDFSVTARTGEDGRTRVSVEGTVTGLEERNNTTYALVKTRWQNGETKWNSIKTGLHSRAQSLSGVTLNATALNSSYGINQAAGTVTYAYEFDDRPTNSIAGAISEAITVTDFDQGDVFAVLPVLGRAVGPVLQDIATKTAKRRSISIEAVLKAKTQGFTPTKPNTDSIVNTHKPTGTQVFKEEDTTSWTENDGRYSRQVGFTYE